MVSKYIYYYKVVNSTLKIYTVNQLRLRSWFFRFLGVLVVFLNHRDGDELTMHHNESTYIHMACITEGKYTLID